MWTKSFHKISHIVVSLSPTCEHHLMAFRFFSNTCTNKSIYSFEWPLRLYFGDYLSSTGLIGWNLSKICLIVLQDGRLCYWSPIFIKHLNKLSTLLCCLQCIFYKCHRRPFFNLTLPWQINNAICVFLKYEQKQKIWKTPVQFQYWSEHTSTY